MVDAAYAAWRADRQDGRATVLVTDSNESVQVLNQRARTDLILDGTVDARREVGARGAPARARTPPEVHRGSGPGGPMGVLDPLTSIQPCLGTCALDVPNV